MYYEHDNADALYVVLRGQISVLNAKDTGLINIERR